MAFCGICGTDIHEYLKGPILLPPKDGANPHTGARLPLTLGHEMSGCISELGSDVTAFALGQNVVVNPAMDDRHHHLPRCDLCAAQKQNVCVHSTFYGLQASAGGFADEICVKAIAVHPIPKGVSLKVAALAEPLAVASHMIRISGFAPNQSALVLGAGPIGCALTWFLKKKGARHIVVSEITSHRTRQAYECGADIVVNPTNGNTAVLDEILRREPLGAHVAFDASGLQSTLDEAFGCTRPAGVVFNVAIHDKPLFLDLNLLTLSEKRLLAGNAYTTEDYLQVLKAVESHEGELEKFITGTVSLEKAVIDGFEELIHNKSRHNKILVEVQGDSASIGKQCHRQARL